MHHCQEESASTLTPNLSAVPPPLTPRFHIQETQPGELANTSPTEEEGPCCSQCLVAR